MAAENQMMISDEFCKRVLRIKPVFAYLLHECVDEFSTIPKEEILNLLYQENTSQMIQELNTEDIEVSGAKILYDIMTRVTNGKEEVLIDLEPQGRIRSEYPLMKRGAYNSARIVSSQKNKPYGFQGSDFKQLKKCYSIWVVINAPKSMKGIHNLYQMHELQKRGNHKEHEKNYDMQRIVLLCLTDEIDVKDKGVVMMLSVLFSSKLSIRDKVFILKEEYGIMLTEEEEKEAEVMSETWLGFYYNGLEDGVEQGIEKGIVQGIEQGKLKATSENICVLMKNLHIDAETAMKFLEVPENMKTVILNHLNNR